MNTERPTPRTDEVAAKQEGQLCGGANLNFARTLERELAEAREELARLKAQPQTLPRPDEAAWIPGPANGGGGTAGPCTDKYPSGQWWDGDELLVVVDVRSNKTGEEWREYRAVRILCDEESFHVEQMDDGDDIGWEPESWSWYMPIPSLPATPPPPPPEKGVEG